MNGWSNLLLDSMNSIVALIISLLVSHLYLETPYWSKSQVYLGFTRVTRRIYFFSASKTISLEVMWLGQYNR